jgi:hypothetical protein
MQFRGCRPVARRAPIPVPTLRLITCGGDFDYERNSYDDNVVVFAVAVT